MHTLDIDYLTEAVAVDLKKQLTQDLVQRPFPLNYHDRSQQILPAGGVLQKNLDKIENFVNINQMKINESKSNFQLF